MRGETDLNPLPSVPVSVVPEFENGQPALLNVGGVPVLLAGDGTIWAWRKP